MKRLIYISIFLLIPFTHFCQEVEKIVVYAQVIDGDTIPIVPLKQVYVYSFKIIESKKQARKYSRLIRNVKRVYPLAKLAGIKLREYEEILIKATSDHERKKIMKQAEKELKENYGGELKKLTFSQGKILIKLVDRETGNSSYDLVAELRGKFVAFFWQTFARLFGFNLKTEYDPEGEDKQIEMIVRMIENGQL
ncbi:MAG: DUF4294 domain-containing protein [Bacteroidetes bacterium]|nr:DUF4294 domain-containing protein [Bacteroidota bacterium]